MQRELRTHVARQLLDSIGGGICNYCGKRVNAFLPPSDPRRATFDHLVPRSRGGADELSNLVVACKACNSRKGSLPADRFRRLRKRGRG